jgi:hypothetical protein
MAHRLALTAMVLALCVIPAHGGHHAPLPAVRRMARLERPVHWVGASIVHENKTRDTEVLSGVLSLDGR